MRRIFAHTHAGDSTIPITSLASIMYILESVISTKEANYIISDIKDVYLGTPMSEYKYMHILLLIILYMIIHKYNFLTITHNIFLIVEIQKEMYSLP